MAQYIAIAKGYDGVKVREVGEKFHFAGKPGKWMKLVEEPKKAASKKGAEENGSEDQTPSGKEGDAAGKAAEADKGKGNKRKNDQEIG